MEWGGVVSPPLSESRTQRSRPGHAEPVSREAGRSPITGARTRLPHPGFSVKYASNLLLEQRVISWGLDGTGFVWYTSVTGARSPALSPLGEPK